MIRRIGRMPISIKAPEADRLALEEQKRQDKAALIEELRAISHHCASLPVIDTCGEDEIMGWDENGLPT
jgi:hypothetical protein